MDEITRDIYLCRDSLPQPIRYVAGTNAIPIVLKFRDFTLPSGGVASIYMTKPSGLIVYNEAELDEESNSIIIQPTTQMFAESGSQFGQVQIVDGEMVAVTFQLPFIVGKNMVDDEAIESSDEYTALETMIAQAKVGVGYYGVCETPTSTIEKVVTVSDSFSLVTGVTVRVKFTYGDANGPTESQFSVTKALLNVNDTGAVEVRFGDTEDDSVGTYSRGWFNAGAVVQFTYDGTYWIAQMPSQASARREGVVMLTDSVTSTSSTTAATPNAVKKAYDAATAAQDDVDTIKPEVSYYGTCSTISSTAAKTVTVSDSFALAEGASVKIKFNDTNTVSSPTLNVNETSDIAMIMYDGTAVGTYQWRPGAVVAFTYNGTNWVIQQPATATTTYYGLAKLSSSVSSTSTSTAATSSAVRTAYNAAVNAQEAVDELSSSAVQNQGTLTSSDDLDDIMGSDAQGVYTWSSTSIPANAPTGSVHGWLFVLYVADMTVQWAGCANGGIIYTYARRYFNSEWGDWNQV